MNIGWLLEDGDPGFDESRWVPSHELELSREADEWLTSLQDIEPGRRYVALLREQVEETREQ